MSRYVAISIVLGLCVSTAARADTPLGRLGATVGIQQTDRTAWVFGPAAEIHIWKEWSIRGEAQLELGNIDDPFGPSNIRGGDGPHVNHVIFGPSWRPEKYLHYDLALGFEAGEMVMHSLFAEKEFTKGVAAGVFVQGGRRLGPIALAVQLRVDFSKTVEMGGPDGDDVTTTSGRLNFVFEVPVEIP